MSEASRLLHAGTEEERALLRAGAEEEPTQESVLAAARVLGLAPRAALFASLAALLARALKGSSLTFTTFVVAPAVLAGAITVAYVASKWAARAPGHAVAVAVASPAEPEQAPALPPAPASLPALPASPESAPSVTHALAAADVLASAHAKKESAAGAARASQDADLAEQVRLVDRGRALAASGDASGALAVVDAYDRRFAHGILAEEAALVRIQATQARGDRADSASLARRFLAQYPESVHRGKVQWLLGDGAK
jgi:hypothetical protein